MSDDNVLITGTPRSGTTLTCHLLNMVPDTVALHEPMRVGQFRGPEEVCDAVERFCAEQRDSIVRRKRAISKHADGAVPDNPVGKSLSGAGLRERLVSKGEIVIDKELSPDFTLAVKHCGAFTATLDRLVPRFPVFAIVRNPLSTLASWRTVEFAVQRGHVPNAERLDPTLHAELAALPDDLDRQIHLLHWFHDRIRQNLPEQAIVPYEAIVDTGGAALAAIRPGAANLAEPLQSKNANTLYDRDSMLRIGERLLASDGAYWQSYSRTSVEQLLEELVGIAEH
jgi:hypothetical protein